MNKIIIIGKIRAIVIFLLLSFIGYSLHAQSDELKVDDFYFDATYTLEIRTQTDTVKDFNGDPCGLVVLRLAVPDAKIEGSYIVKVEKGEGEWYVWLAKGASYIVIKSSDYLPLEYSFPEPIKSLSSYVMIVKKPDVFIYVQVPHEKQKKRYYNGDNTLAFFESAIMPGLGQWCKGYAGYGIANLLGEVALVGGAVYFYNDAQKYNAGISNGQSVNTETVSLYNSRVTTYRVLLGSAIALYVFNLLQAVIIEPNANYFDNVYLSPMIMPIDNIFVPGMSLAINL